MINKNIYKIENLIILVFSKSSTTCVKFFQSFIHVQILSLVPFNRFSLVDTTFPTIRARRMVIKRCTCSPAPLN